MLLGCWRPDVGEWTGSAGLLDDRPQLGPLFKCQLDRRQRLNHDRQRATVTSCREVGQEVEVVAFDQLEWLGASDLDRFGDLTVPNPQVAGGGADT